jgi:hypothetical protein
MTLILASVSPTSLSTGYNFNDAVQKFRHLRRNRSESVWGYSPVLLLQYKNEKKILTTTISPRVVGPESLPTNGQQ